MPHCESSLHLLREISWLRRGRESDFSDRNPIKLGFLAFVAYWVLGFGRKGTSYA